MVCNRHPDFKIPWKIEIVFPVLLYTIRRPHGIGIIIDPVHIFLVEYHTVIRVIHQIGCGKHMIVFHKKIINACFPVIFRDVMGRINIQLALEYPRCRIGCINMRHQWIVSKCRDPHTERKNHMQKN